MGLKLAVVLTILGAAAVVYGVSMIFLPAAVILAGVLLAAAGLLPNWGS